MECGLNNLFKTKLVILLLFILQDNTVLSSDITDIYGICKADYICYPNVFFTKFSFGIWINFFKGMTALLQDSSPVCFPQPNMVVFVLLNRFSI